MQDTDLYDEETDTYYGHSYVDEDDDFDNYHCAHGTYIGTPGGPDLMCGWCESGATEQEYREYQKNARMSWIRDQAVIWFLRYINERTSIIETFGMDKKDGSFITWWKIIKDEVEGMQYEELVAIESTVANSSYGEV